MRPGTDIAFVNGLVRYILDWMESNPADPKSINFFSYLNQGGDGVDGQQFFTNKSPNRSAPALLTAAGVTKFGSKFTDARFLVNAAGTDYVRENVEGHRRSARSAARRRDHDLRLPQEVRGLQEPGHRTCC